MSGCRGHFAGAMALTVMLIAGAMAECVGQAADGPSVAPTQAPVIRGTVTRGGQPVQGAAIWVRGSLQGFDIPVGIAISGADGRYALNVPAGTCYVSAHLAGYASTPAQREVTVYASTTVDFALSRAPPAPGDGVETGRGVLVGISDYAGTAYDLNYCDADALEFARTLAARRNWRQENLMLVLNRRATGDAIYAAVQRMATLADADDLCLFFFSGHGGRVRGATDPMRDAYLVETNLINNVYDDDLGGWIAELPTTKFMGVIAACYSGGFINASDAGEGGAVSNDAGSLSDVFAEGLLRSIERNRRISPTALSRNGFGVVITASRDDQSAWESSLLRHDVLVYYLLEGMEGPADANADGWISAQELHAWAAPRATAFSPGQAPQLFEARPGVPLNFLDLGTALPHAVTVTSDPQGTPLTAMPREQVACSVTAEDSRGGALSYLWTADLGDFDDAWSRTPRWTAPPNATGDDLAVTISVTVRSVEDPSVFDEGSFTVTVLGGQQGDVHITRGPTAAPADLGPGEVVSCSVEVDDGPGAGVNYLWRALDGEGREVGGFDDASAAAPTWTAPAVPADLSLVVTVTSLTGPEHTDTGRAQVRVLARLASTLGLGPRMVAVPGRPVGVNTVGEALGASATAAWDALAQDYAVGHDPTVGAGVGCWALFDAPTDVGLLSVPVDDDRFSWNLRAGWNLVGNPWPESIHLGGLTSNPSGRVPALAWNYWDGGYQLVAGTGGILGVSSSLRPWRSYWLHAAEDCVVTLDRTVGPAAAATDGDGDGWTVTIMAATASGRDEGTVLGVTSGEPLMAAHPPAPLRGPVLALLDPGGRRLGVDLRSQGEERPEWEIAVSARPGEQVELSWPDLSALPGDLRLLLIDRDCDAIVSMRTVTSYRYVASEALRRFTVRAERGGALLAVSGLVAAQSGRGASISYVLSAPAEVTVELRNIAGRRVRGLVRDRTADAGARTLTWDLRSDMGTPVPAGRYLVHLTARGDAGEVVSALAPLQVRR